jgi:hypothetical protein
MLIKLTLRERILFKRNKLPTPILDAFANVLSGKALMLSNSSGIFDALAESPKSAGEVAAAVGLSVRGTEALLESMEAAGYVSRQGHQFRNTQTSEKWLVSKSPHSIGNLVRYFEMLFQRWQYLGETVAEGGPRTPYYDFFTDSDWRTYVSGMMDLARLLMPEVLNVVVLPADATRLLDLGGSHGLYSIELSRRYSKLTAEVVDFQPAIAIGRRIAEELGVGQRVSYRAADFTSDALGNGYDAVLVFNVIHGLKSLENLELLRKVAAALNKRGTVFIMDQIKERDSVSKVSHLVSAVVGLNLFNEIGGNAYTFGEISEWCQEAGLSQCVMKRLRMPGVAVIRATRP